MSSAVFQLLRTLLDVKLSAVFKYSNNIASSKMWQITSTTPQGNWIYMTKCHANDLAHELCQRLLSMFSCTVDKRFKQLFSWQKRSRRLLVSSYVIQINYFQVNFCERNRLTKLPFTCHSSRRLQKILYRDRNVRNIHGGPKILNHYWIINKSD